MHMHIHLRMHMQVCIGGWKACPLLVLRAEADAKTRLQQVEPEQLTRKLLEEIKLRRPQPSVKGTIWNLIGALHKKFGPEVAQYRVES